MTTPLQQSSIGAGRVSVTTDPRGPEVATAAAVPNLPMYASSVVHPLHPPPSGLATDQSVPAFDSFRSFPNQDTRPIAQFTPPSVNNPSDLLFVSRLHYAAGRPSMSTFSSGGRILDPYNEYGGPAGATRFDVGSFEGGYDIFGYWKNVLLPYFDVTTDQVKTRLRLAVSTRKTSNRLFWDTVDITHTSATVIDLYGAFWIPLTLCMGLAIISNVTSWLTYYNRIVAASDIQGSTPTDLNRWTPHLNAFLISFFVVGIGVCTPTLLIWADLGVFGHNHRFTEILSLIGYSFTPILLAVVAATIPLRFLQWVALLAAGLVAARFVVTNLKKSGMRDIWTQGVWTSDQKDVSPAGMLALLLFYSLYCAFLKCIFF